MKHLNIVIQQVAKSIQMLRKRLAYNTTTRVPIPLRIRT